MIRRFLVLVPLAAIAVAALAYAARQPLLTGLGRFLIVRDAARPAEAIVVLSGSLPDRILEAVDLYQARLAPRIILTRGPVLPGLAILRQRGGNVPEPHEENQIIAQQLGVPAAAIVLIPTPVSSTIAEAQLVVNYLHAQRLKSVLLVTSQTHARRAAMIFRHVAGDSVQVAVCPSPYDSFTPESWWRERGIARRVVTEYAKLLNYLLIDRWRTPPSE
ncbi:MAG: YdcF family protein [Candidatus Binatia bacterium]|jgi:uncharacterized SAM-binding protein YcdF (DUF218 family)